MKKFDSAGCYKGETKPEKIGTTIHLAPSIKAMLKRLQRESRYTMASLVEKALVAIHGEPLQEDIEEGESILFEHKNKEV